MSINRGMDKEDVVYIYIYTHTHIHTVEYYSAIKRNEIVPLAEMWMDLEIVIHSKISQKEKSKYRIISLICGI